MTVADPARRLRTFLDVFGNMLTLSLGLLDLAGGISKSSTVVLVKGQVSQAELHRGKF